MTPVAGAPMSTAWPALKAKGPDSASSSRTLRGVARETAVDDGGRHGGRVAGEATPRTRAQVLEARLSAAGSPTAAGGS